MQTLLDVYCNDILIGKLKLTSDRKFEFEYLNSWLENDKAFPLSIMLPLNPKVYLDKMARPFFENLLPEAEIRYIIAKKFGISEKNIFLLLEKIGGECAGAISLFPHKLSVIQNGTYELLNENSLDNLINELPKHPLMADKHLRLSLAGAQHKLPIYINNNQFYLPKGNPSSHILKIPINRFFHTVQNEFFCMTLARNMGLPIPKTFIHKHQQPLYIIERYDRQKNESGDLQRIHQEDFCQALGFLSDQKYESEGGPSLKSCFDLVKEYSYNGGMDILNLLRWVIFNFLIGNADAHAKNLAFVFSEDGLKLAPFYDILCTHLYSELDERYAMKIGGENRPLWIQKRHWERFSEIVNIKFNLVLTEINYMIDQYYDAVEKTMIDLKQWDEEEQQTIVKITKLIEARIQQLKSIHSPK